MTHVALFLFTFLACPAPTQKNDTANPTDGDGDGWTVGQGDCVDTMASINPGVAEVACDGVDNNCDGYSNNDGDEDGHDCVQWGGDDCDDANADIHPLAEDVCGDGVDTNCDKWNECDCDNDGYEMISDACPGGNDCDDDDPDFHPGATDACYDGVDQNCDGGDDEYDCDGDGHLPLDQDGDDCDDTNEDVNPEAVEECWDGLDNDCDPATSDCDCDEDGYEATSCGGDDCDDTEEEINPAAVEDIDDELDNDCDGEVDEVYYCNVYAPLANGASAKRDYDWTVNKITQTETDTLIDYDAASDSATLRRAVSSILSTAMTDEPWVCDGTGVSMDGYAYDMGIGIVTTYSYSSPYYFLLNAEDMSAGTTWDYDYVASASGRSQWETVGTFTVVGFEDIDTKAGLFKDALVLENVYVTTSTGAGGLYDASGTVTSYWVPKLGLVYSNDINSAGKSQEEYELTAYSGFEP